MSIKPVFPNHVFPFGTHVCREPHQDLDELMADLPLLKRLGFNMIKIQEHWSKDEPREGEYDFSVIERIISRAGELGLGVYLGLTMEQAPAWLWRKYADCRMVYANGLPHEDPTQYCTPSDGKPGPCWDHPGARAAGEKFLTELIRRLGRFDNIWAWNTWQEVCFWPSEARLAGFCYCPYTLAGFRKWLKEKYVSLSSLNKTWGSAYGDWEEIIPPRKFWYVPPFIDWRYFMADVYLVQSLEWRTKIIRAKDPKHRPVFSHVGDQTIGNGALWRWARVGDFFGNSNYPYWFVHYEWDDESQQRPSAPATAANEIWNGIMSQVDYCRCANGRDRAYWSAEFQGGPISRGWNYGKVPTAADIRRWVLSSLASGLTGINFWNHRSEHFWGECNGYGLLNPKGNTTDRIEEAGRLARAVNQEPEIFSMGQPPKARVALLVNEDLYHFCQGSGEIIAALYSYNLRGHYARLWRLGIPVDFLDTQEVFEGALQDYQAAILTMPLALDEAYFAQLRKFVEAGGTLISEACPGRFDKYGFCPRSQMVAGGEELFGARHKELRVIKEPGDTNRWTPEERGFGGFLPPLVLKGTGDYASEELQPTFYLQTLEPEAGVPILKYGEETAGVMNVAERGKAVLLGTFTGVCATAHTHLGTDRFFERLLYASGVTPDRCGRLLRRRRVLDTKEAWFLINPHDKEVEETVDVSGYKKVRDLLGDTIVKRDADQLAVKVPGGNLSCLVLER